MKTYRFAVVAKSINNVFFKIVKPGCEDGGKELSTEDLKFECVFLGADTEGEGDEATEGQIEILEEIIQNKTKDDEFRIDGVAIASNNADVLTPIIDRVVDNGIPVITFDSDAPDSKRMVLVGTDNPRFGEMLGKVLLQIGKDQVSGDEDGGTYSILSARPSYNLLQREKGIEKKLDGTKWKLNEIIDGEGSVETSLRKMRESMIKFPNQKALIPVGAWPMNNATGWTELVEMYPNVTTVVGDAFDSQIQLAKRMKVHALVGQMPFLMGKFSMTTLKEIVHDKKQYNQEDVLPTKILQIITVPLLQEPDPDKHYIGHLRIIPYTFYSIIVATAIAFGVWTWTCRDSSVVKASQPIFLWLILAGTVIFSTVLIPFTIDDERTDIKGCSMACQSVFWFVALGITTIFSALFSKAWRLNKIVKNSMRCRRVVVTVKDVIVPFIIMLALNIIVLITWNIHDPLRWERNAHAGTDDWNRILSTYGACTSDHGGIYLLVLFVIAFTPMVLATIQYVQVRNIQTDFNESSYIGVVVLVYVQALLLGAPIFGLIREQPRIFIVVISIIVFVTAMATLVLIFVPKILFNKKKQRESVHVSDRGNTSLAVIKMRAGKESKSTRMMNFIESSMHENTNRSSLPKGNATSESMYRRSTSLPEEDRSSETKAKRRPLSGSVPGRLETIESTRLLQQKGVSIEDSSEEYGMTFVNTARNLNSRNASSLCSSVENIVEEQNEVEGNEQDIKEECEDKKEECEDKKEECEDKKEECKDDEINGGDSK